ncbi:MAG: hypothetical protein FWB71_01330, partial [Defluviitaleaceae bacterium]|nr:hypothetical protein [Defluviitaleaceae bacterium]
KVLWLLSKCLMDNKDYENALAKCEAGLKIAIDHVVGRHVSDLVYTKALCLCHLGRRDEGEVFLYYAYFCYLLQGDKKGADKVWQHARDVLGINIQTYGAENLAHSRDVAEFEPVGIPFASAEDNIGSVIRGLRLHAGLPAKAIYSGLCSKGNYSLIESGKVKQADISLLRAIFQRLGRDINLFFTAFLSKDEIDEMNLRDEVRNLLIDWKFDEAAAPLEELRKLPSAKTRLGQQYLMLFDINMLRGREGFTQAFLDLTHEALAITIPDFDEEKIENYRLSHMEATLINVLAAYYSNTGDWPRSRDVYSRLINNLKRFCVDEPELIAIYTAALSNYISFMLRTEIVELCKDVYPLADECIKLCKRYGRFHMLPKTYGNIGYALDGEGRLEECIPYFAMAYYGHVIAGDLFNRKKLVEWLKERLGHTFVH